MAVIIFLGRLSFSDCKLGGNDTPFPNFSTVFQIHTWSADTAYNYQMVHSRINTLALPKKE